MTATTRYALVSQALAGIHADGLTDGNRSSLSGCSSDWSAFLADHGHQIEPGAYVVDKRTVPESELVSLVYRSPMPDVKLPPATATAAPDPADPIVATIAGAYFGDAGLAGLALSRGDVTEPGPFDEVDTLTYALWWGRRGARLGRVIAGEILWWDAEMATPGEIQNAATAACLQGGDHAGDIRRPCGRCAMPENPATIDA